MLLLFVSFLIQPVHKAIAAQDDVVETPQEVSAEPVKEQIVEQEVIEIPEEVEIEIEEETLSDTTTDELEEVVVIDEDNATSTDTELEEESSATSTDEVVSETETDTEPDVQETTNDAEDNSESEIADNENQDAEVATTTEENSDEKVVVEAESLISEDNFYQFSKQSCVAVGDGTYHCSSSDATEYDSRSVVFADLGESKNMEIFLRTSKGDLRQITDNEYDDTAPYYDATTLQIVWQRLIDGRYQIILYDIVKDKESQLTFSRTNNMEPKVSEDGVVWQAWDNNDWEIMYFDGAYTDQITDNIAQDVTPVIQDKYILWTVIGKTGQEAKVFSLSSKEILTISGYDGGVIDNPRFVLVYDTKFENGDVITQGFDPTTGISEPIAAKPAEDPIDIPLPDPIGEIRALIQGKSSFEDEIDQGLIHSDGTGTSPTVTSDTLDLKGPSTTDVVISSSTTVSDVFELTEYDLILTESKVDFDALVDDDLEVITELIFEDLENAQ